MERTCSSVKDKRGCILLEGHSGNHRTYSGTLQWHNENDPDFQSQSIKSDRISESTIARIAGNLLSGVHGVIIDPDALYGYSEIDNPGDYQMVRRAVWVARMIANQVEHTRENPNA